MERTRTIRRAALALVTSTIVASAVVMGPAPAGAGELPVDTRLVSRDNAGATIAGTVQSDIALSDNGRFVAFTTAAAIVGADTNGKKDIYVRDLWAGTTDLVSLTDGDQPTNGDSTEPSISDDGRFVAFLSNANNLVPNDDKGRKDVFVRDRFEGTTRWLSPSLGGGLLDNEISSVTISGDGTATAFTTSSSLVVGNDTNGQIDVFVRETFGTSVDRVSVFPDGTQAPKGGTNPVLSDDGRYVAFYTDTQLAGGVNGKSNVYRHDRTTGNVALVNVKNGGGVPNDWSSAPSISGDGRFVAFASNASDIVSGDTNETTDVFVRDMNGSSVVRASFTNGLTEIAEGITFGAGSLSDDGKKVLFATTGIAAGGTDVGPDFDLFVRDMTNSTTRRVSTGPSVPDPGGQIVAGDMDGSGRLVAFRASPKLTGESFDQGYVWGPVPLGPFASSAAAIAAQYQDFLGRAPTAAETSAWSTRFSKAQGQVPALVAALASDPAFSAKRAPLIRLYWAFFLRRPDASGLNYWLGKYQGGASLTSIAQSFAKSSEFTNRYGTVTNQQYVQKVYLNVFNRQPDASGLAYWTKKLDAKQVTRGAVIVQFSESNEGKRRLAGPTNITLVSLGMLRTTPSAAQWAALYEPVSLGAPQSLAFAAGVLLTGSQYDARY